MDSKGRKRFYSPYMWTVVLGGVLVLVVTVNRLCTQELGLPFWLLAFATVLIASHIVVKFFRFDTHISVSDIFVFLALLLLGREAAVVIGASESLFSSV